MPLAIEFHVFFVLLTLGWRSNISSMNGSCSAPLLWRTTACGYNARIENILHFSIIAGIRGARFVNGFDVVTSAD